MEPKTLEESNRALKRQFIERSAAMRQKSIKESFGVDLTKKETYDFDSPFFSWKKFREASYELAKRTSLREAQAETVFSQLLRAGINNIANNWYLLVPTNHEQVGANTVSNKLIEPYAPVHRGGVPRRVAPGEQFPETKVSGLDIQIVNEKFGAITAFERELFDDDQTAQIGQRARDIGDNMAILEDAWFFQRFIGSAGSYAGDTIPASQTKPANEANWPYSSTGLVGGGKNKPSSFGAFTSANVQAGHIALMAMLDLLGNKMLVNPNTLVVDPNNNFTVATLLNSEWYPTNVTAKVGGGAGADSTIGTTYARNVMKGLYNPVISRFMPAKAWALGEAGKGIVFQRRDPLEVVQENPQSGPAFTVDTYRFRARSRWEPDWVDPRFWWLGDDGSV